MTNKINKYSSTLFQIVKEHNLLKKTVDQLNIIKQLYKREATFRLLCESKRIENSSKHAIIKNVLKDFDDIIIEFLYILINHQQTKYTVQIINKFIDLATKELNASKIEVTTAKPVSNEMLQKLFGESKYTIKNIVDDSIIGGIKIKHENTIIDNSIIYQLSQLKKTLHNV